jgi:hypothetical protein
MLNTLYFLQLSGILPFCKLKHVSPLMRSVLALALLLQISCAFAEEPASQFPSAANAFLERELPSMEAAVAAKDRTYFLPALERMKVFLAEWGGNSPKGSVVLESFPACTNAVTDFLIGGLCRISPPGSLCEPSTFLPRIKDNIRQCRELARANPSINTDARR